MKVKWLLLVCLLMAVLVVVGCAPTKAPKAGVPAGYESIRMVGGSLGSKVSTSVMAFAAVLNKYYPETEWSSSTGSTSANPAYVTKGTHKLAVAASANYIGAYGFDNVPQSRLRSLVASTPHNWYFFIIPADKPWKDISEVPKGLTLNVGTGSEPFACGAYLEAAGLGKKDFNTVSTGKAELGDMWRAGKVDLAFFAVAGADPIIVDLMASPRKIKPMGLSSEQAAKATAQKTFEVLGFDPPVTTNLTEIAGEIFKYEIISTRQPNFLVSRDDFPEEIAYKMVKVFDEHVAELAQVSPPLKYVTPQWHIKLARPPFDIHPGVAKYYKEKGYLK